MDYSLSYINEMTRKDPKGFVEECDEAFHSRIVGAADKIISNLKVSPIVLLSGPSGSGKTTTAQKVEEELRRRGIVTHTVSMDNYFKTINPKTAPRTPEGDLDFESPLCVDMDLLNSHFSMLNEGKEIRIPHFMFARQKRSMSQFTPMKLGKDEIAIFEGIHALNDDITGKHPEAFKLYIAASSHVMEGDDLVFRGRWARITRRTVRDNLFRGSDAEFTLSLWPNILRGEKNYVKPFRYKADQIIDSFLPYEVPVLKQFALPLFETLPVKEEIGDEVLALVAGLRRFETLDPEYIPADSLIREFIGGGIYEQ